MRCKTNDKIYYLPNTSFVFGCLVVMAHTFLFTGQEPYLLQQELRTRLQGFREKYGDQGIFIFRSDALDAGAIANALMSGGMFSTKKLIIIYGIPSDTIAANKARKSESEPVETYLMQHREQISPDNILVLVSYKPDKRTKAYKFFSSKAEIKLFKPLKDKDLARFVQKQLGDLITASQANLIVGLVGSTMFNLAHECEKLQMYANYHRLASLSDEDIQNIVYSQAQIDSFKILDNLFTDKEKALDLITLARDEQQDMFKFLGMLYRGLKLIIQIVDLHRQGVRSSKEMASTIKIHPFAVAKQHKHIERLDQHYDAIVDLYQQLVQLDYSIKTGRYPAEGFWTAIKTLVREL